MMPPSTDMDIIDEALYNFKVGYIRLLPLEIMKIYGQVHKTKNTHRNIQYLQYTCTFFLLAADVYKYVLKKY